MKKAVIPTAGVVVFNELYEEWIITKRGEYREENLCFVIPDLIGKLVSCISGFSPMGGWQNSLYSIRNTLY